MRRTTPRALVLVMALGIAPPAHAAPSPGLATVKPAARATPSTGRAAPRRAATPPRRAAQAEPPAAVAQSVRTFEERGAYAEAADRLHTLRGLVAPDADLDIWWAIDLARVGALASASTLLASPLVTQAFGDSMNARHYRIYGWGHETDLVNGHYDGWYWYVARARA